MKVEIEIGKNLMTAILNISNNAALEGFEPGLSIKTALNIDMAKVVEVAITKENENNA